MSYSLSANSRNVAPAFANLCLLRATDVLAEQQHKSIKVAWPNGIRPPLESLAILDVISQGQGSSDDLYKAALLQAGLRVSPHIAKEISAIPKLYGVDTLAQATGAAICGGDLGYTLSSKKSNPTVRRAVRMVVRAWAKHPNGPQDLRRILDDPLVAYKALGTTYPPAVVRGGYEQGYLQPPNGSTNGWYHRRVFVPLIDPPGLLDREKIGLQAVANDLTGDETPYGRHNQRYSLQQVYDRFGLRRVRIGALAVTLGISLGEIDVPEIDDSGMKLLGPRELEAMSFAACGLSKVGIGHAMQISPSTSNLLLERARQKLKVHHTSAGIARLFAKGIFIKGRLSKKS